MIKKLAIGIVSLGIASAAMATTYNGNGATGFGGTLGNGSLTLTDDGTTISGTFTAGSAFNDTLVLYIDSTTTGANVTSTAGLTDTADGGRKSISAFDGTNRATINLPIAADFALMLSPTQNSFGGLWSLSNGANLPFVASANMTNIGNAGPTSYNFTINLADLGLTAGQSFNFVADYLNGSNAFLSNETLNGTTGLGGTNPGQNTTSTLAGFQTYTTTAPIPEPATVLLVGPAILGGMFFLRRRRA